MPIAAESIQSQLQKLGKSLKRLPEDFSPERVHQLRTRTRRMEAIVKALALDSHKNERQLLKAIRPVRKQAGKVRDMDVLTDFASELQVEGHRECSVELLEYLGAQRQRYARKLQKVAVTHSPEIKKRLNGFTKLLKRALKNGKDNSDSMKWSAKAAALALQLEAELRDWPALSRKNLHPFRLKVKELGYVLEMAQESDSEFVARLGEVKDTVGEWHDWEELAEIAAECIHHRGCELQKRIRSTAKVKFEQALSIANRMRHSLAVQTLPARKGAVSKAPASGAKHALASVSALAA